MCSEVVGVYKQLLVLGVSQDPLHGSPSKVAGTLCPNVVRGIINSQQGVRVFASDISEMPVVHQDCWGHPGAV